MTEMRSLHDSAVLVKPNLPAKPTTYWIAILHADKVPNGNNGEADWLWIKRITAQTIKDQCEKRALPNENCVLRHESKVSVNLQATMHDLDTYNDRLIAFEAVKASDASRLLAPRQALQNKSNQTLSPPPKQSSALDIDGKVSVRPSPGSGSEFTNKTVTGIENHAVGYENRQSQLHAPGGPPVPSHQSASHVPLAKTRSPSTSHRSSPAVQAVPRPSGTNYRSGSSGTDSLLSGISYNPLAAQRPMPLTHSSSPSATPDQQFPTSAGFHRFYETISDRVRASFPSYTEVQVQEFVRRQWASLAPPQQESYQAQARLGLSPKEADGQSVVPARSCSTSTPASDAIKRELKTEIETQTKFPIDEPPLSAAELDEQSPKTFQLQTLLKDAGPKMLESSVQQGVELLDQLKAPLVAKAANDPDAGQWIQQIDDLRKQAVKTKTVIGVQGNTGSGKSSMLNAMLDEERLVPTNCMRACTAVVTEISYNYEEEPYRAQIEFISPTDWEKELRTLFQDLLDGNGQVSRDCANEDTDAGIAYAKIKAVYPRKTKEDIANSNVETMLREVSHVLGSSRDIKETDSLLFYKKLQHFVDSKEKSTGNKDKDKKKERKDMEFWPLIRVVRIYVKSSALATGAVMVDLPGVHDANAARSAVAEGYMKQCTGLWIVAPITRAVDDKAAKSLLGESFKRQLKMDGGFSSVTFICSKTDDISLEEAQDSLGLEDEMGPDWAEMDQLVKKQRSMKKRLEEMKDSKAVYGEVMNDVDEQIEVWDALKDGLEEGKTVFPPRSKGTAKKRKPTGKDKSRRKKARTSRSSETEETEDSNFEVENSEDDEERRASSEDEAEDQEPLTHEQIAAKLQELRATKKEARGQKSEITANIAALRKEIDSAKEAEDKIQSKMSAMCISGRNQYSKGAIQQDFAAGIKELDQELAAEEDEENFNPDTEARDYDEVARGLPVFCVSSRGYQKLQGRLRKDAPIAGFTTIEETGIPQLQAHCEKLTETGRSANCRTFVNKLSQLLNSMTLWASSDGTGANLTAEQRAREARYLQTGLKTLESGLETAVKTVCSELNEEFADNIFDKYKTAVSNATNDAIDTSYKWGAPVNREDRAAGGLHWSTYKAICRRNGIYANAQGPHEWNVQLVEPMLKIIASGWEKTFARRLPMVMANFSRNAATPLRKFHRDIEARARKIGSSIAGLSMLSHQVGTYESILKDFSTTIKDLVNSTQRDINREFTPVIERAMLAAYDVCVDERGTGSFARMKAHMNSHVAHERHTMFQQSADNVQTRLEEMVKHVKDLMDDKTDEVFTQMRRDYRSIIGGCDIPQEGEMLPKDQRLVRREVMKVIEGVEKSFMKVAGLSADDEDDNKENDDFARHMDADKEEEQASSVEEEEARNDCFKREMTPTDQLVDSEGPERSPTSKVKPAKSADDPMSDNYESDDDSEPKMLRTEAEQGFKGLARNETDSDPDASDKPEDSDSD